MRQFLRIFAVAAGLGWACAAPGAGPQTAPQGQKAAAGEQTGSAPAISEKQRKLLEDSAKLVQMAAELKVSVDKSNKNELSLDVVRKAEAVEKLAKSLKERIREAR